MNGSKESTVSISRRQFLGNAGALAGVAVAGSTMARPFARQTPSRPHRPSGVTLNVWMYSEPSRTAIQNTMIQEFQAKYPTIKLNVTRTDFSTYYTKLATDIAAGTLPDVFMMSGAYFYQAAHVGALRSLESNIKQSKLNLADYFGEPSGEDVRWGGVTYGIPGEIDQIALAYNKSIFDGAGIKPPAAGWSWAELLDAARTLTKKNKKGQQQYGFYSWNSSQELWGNLLGQAGGSFLNSSYTQGALQTPEGIDAIQFAVDLVNKYKVSPPAQGVSDLPGYIQSTGEPFFTGLIGMSFQGNYEMELLSQLNHFEWDVVPMPKKVASSGLGWYQSWVMGATTKYPDEAWELLHFLVTEGQQITAKSPGRGLTPALKSAAYGSDFSRKTGPNMKAWLDGWATHTSYGFHPAWLQYQADYSKALDAAFAGSTSVKSAITGATPLVNRALAQDPWFTAKAVEQS